MDEEKLLLERKKYYTTLNVKKIITSYTRNREVVTMDKKDNWKCVRGLNVSNVEFFNYFIHALHFYDKNENIYISCARYKFLPKFTLNLKLRSQETKKFFDNLKIRDLKSYDLFLDFDGEKFKDVIKDVNKMINIFTYYGVPFYVLPSGNGFHMVIDGYYIDIELTLENKIIKQHKLLIENIKKIFDLSTLDLKNAGVINRVRKCPYSLMDLHMCKPLMKNELLNLLSLNRKKYDKIFNFKKVIEELLIPHNSNYENINMIDIKFKSEFEKYYFDFEVLQMNFIKFISKCELLWDE